MINGTNNINNINFCNDTINDTYRRDDIIANKCDNDTSIDKKNVSLYCEQIEPSALIFRYKFTEAFMSILYIFSKIHQYDERNDFKEAWTVWIEENIDDIKIESQRLTELGYKGDSLDKMFKSARYYFRKKSIIKVEPKKRGEYISLDSVLLNAMDRHISENIYKKDYQPKIGFVEFSTANIEILKASITKICYKGVTDIKIIQEKIKKTYKNRYFIIKTK